CGPSGVWPSVPSCQKPGAESAPASRGNARLLPALRDVKDSARSGRGRPDSSYLKGLRTETDRPPWAIAAAPRKVEREERHRRAQVGRAGISPESRSPHAAG